MGYAAMEDIGYCDLMDGAYDLILVDTKDTWFTALATAEAECAVPTTQATCEATGTIKVRALPGGSVPQMRRGIDAAVAACVTAVVSKHPCLLFTMALQLHATPDNL